MSLTMTGLAGDFASFYNLEHQEAFDKIRSGISGETEPLKQLGINMSVANLEAYALSKGIETAYKSMTEVEKVTLRYNYLLSVSKDAQGDFARTSDSFANQLRIVQLNIQNLTNSIGNSLLPIASEAIKTIGSMVTQLQDAFDKGGFTGLISEFGNQFADIITTLASFAPKMAEVSLLFIKTFADTLISNLPQIIQAGKEIIYALLSALLGGGEDLKKGVSDIVDYITNTFGDLLSALKPIVEGVGKTIRDLIVNFNDLKPVIEGGIAVLPL